MKNKEREFLQKYSLDNKKFEELLSGPDSPQKVETYFKEFADDVFSQLTADLAEIRQMPMRSKEQQQAMSKLKRDFIKQRQEDQEKEKKKSVLNQVDSTKTGKKDLTGTLVDHVSNKKRKVNKKDRVPKPIAIKPKQVTSVESKVEAKKTVASSEVLKEKSKVVKKTNFLKKVLNIFNKFKPKVRLVSKNIKRKEVDTEAFKKREGDLKDIHDSQKKGTTY
tara:strand:- start:2087 stop:2749 length:663 start_codon:yes stop_codon:yes gene_type:complete